MSPDVMLTATMTDKPLVCRRKVTIMCKQRQANGGKKIVSRRHDFTFGALMPHSDNNMQDSAGRIISNRNVADD